MLVTKLKGLCTQSPEKISSLSFVLHGWIHALKQSRFSYQESDSLYHFNSTRINSHHIQKYLSIVSHPPYINKQHKIVIHPEIIQKSYAAVARAGSSP